MSWERMASLNPVVFLPGTQFLILLGKYLLSNSGSCALHFERPKSKCQFGVRKDLLIKKVPIKKIGDLSMPQLYLTCWTRLRIFKLEKGSCGGLGGGRGGENQGKFLRSSDLLIRSPSRFSGTIRRLHASEVVLFFAK